MLDSQLAPHLCSAGAKADLIISLCYCFVLVLKTPRDCSAGAKADPTRLRIADISESNVDPLARAVRHRLRRQLGVEAGIPVLLSTEKPRCRLVPIAEVGENPLDYQVKSSQLPTLAPAD